MNQRTQLATPKLTAPKQKNYDVVIVGGAMYGSSVAWFLANNPDFNGSILVVERDLSYSACSTVHTNSCIRQQFSREINVRVSQFGAEFVKNFREFMGNDPRVTELRVHVPCGQRRFRRNPKRMP